uniref:Uncharacterized protein n=1 Tax=Noccaea caerulescens TaxID=107243 RepID=A0A1J3FMM8_NOCCA
MKHLGPCLNDEESKKSSGDIKRRYDSRFEVKLHNNSHRRAKSMVKPTYVLMGSFVERMKLKDQNLGLGILETSYEEEDEIGTWCGELAKRGEKERH